MSSPDAPAPLRYDPQAWGFYRDPFPLYAALRSRAPVHPEPLLGGELIVSTHADVRAILRDPAFAPADLQASVSAHAGPGGVHLPAIASALEATLFLQTGAGHQTARRYLARVLGSKALGECAPLAERLVAELFADARARGGLDLVADFADLLPFRFMAELLGVPREDVPFLMDCCDRVVVALFRRHCSRTEYIQLNAQIALALDHLETLVRERRAHPRDDGLSRMIQLGGDEPGLPDRDLAARCYFIFMVGVETTVTFLGGALLALLQNPAELARWRAGEINPDHAQEELLRYVSPVQATLRTAREDRAIRGVNVAAGQRVCALIASANRDETVFADPDRLDLARVPGPHLAFGDGAHSCLGAALARVEGRAAFSAFLTLPDMRLTLPEPEWWPYETIRKPRRLPVSFA